MNRIKIKQKNLRYIKVRLAKITYKAAVNEPILGLES